MWHEPGPDLRGGPSVLSAFLEENQATDEQLSWLADELGCDISVLWDLEVGYWTPAGVFLVPERNRFAQIVGIQRIYPDGIDQPS